MIELELREAEKLVRDTNECLQLLINTHAKLAKFGYDGTIMYSGSYIYITIKGCSDLEYSCGVSAEIEEILDLTFSKPNVSEDGIARYYSGREIILYINFDPGTCKRVPVEIVHPDAWTRYEVVCG